MKYLHLFLLLLLFLVFTKEVSAIENPLSSQNNKFGIHIIDENDLNSAAELVNSNGGEWGYVTVVIREDEREQTRWQNAFNRMSDLKIIPIVRLATKMNSSGYWEKPSEAEAVNWARFLDSLEWPVKNRYVILFNEPNHAKEWGGNVNPEEYISISRVYWEQLKRASSDFFVLPAGLDAAAPNSRDTLSEEAFINRLMAKDYLMVSLFDGWTSHSYPNPGFSGSPYDTGKGSVRTWEWELNYLTKLGVSDHLPVFITETGWKNKGNNDVVGQNYKTAFQEAWNNSQVVAITPFVLSYLSHPFDIFSWKNPTTNNYYPQFEIIKNMPKIKGDPSRDS